MSESDTSTRVSAAPRGLELVVVLIAAVLFILGLLPFPELLLLLAVAASGSVMLASGLASFDDRVTGRGARFALGIALLGLVFAVLGGVTAAVGATAGPASDTIAAIVLDALTAALALGGYPLLMAGGVLAVYFTRNRAAGVRRLRWVAFESALIATVACALVALLGILLLTAGAIASV